MAKFTIIGGGPSGLYFALLAKTRFPDVDVEVLEQNPRAATFGFGIVLADRGLKQFQTVDPLSHDAIVSASFVSHHQMIAHRGRSIFVEGRAFGRAISRLRLLEILQARCEHVGVRVRHQSRVDDPRVLDADLIVGADGVNSILRRHYADLFETTSRNLTNHLAWYGTEQHFAYPLLSFKQSKYGYFWCVGYAYSERMSTFVAECDAQAWARSGLEGKSEEERRTFAEAMFAEELGGKPLISNKSNWFQIPVVRSRNWSVGRCVLIGDALHSAHPSIGSGTRIAMEDSIALVEALSSASDIESGLTAFRRQREPQKQKLVSAAEKSFAWYEDVADKLDRLETAPLIFDYMMRSGRIDEARLEAEFPRFMAAYGAEWKASRAAG